MMDIVLAAVIHASAPRTVQDCRAIFATGETRGDSNVWWLPPSDTGMVARELWLDSCEARMVAHPYAKSLWKTLLQRRSS